MKIIYEDGSVLDCHKIEIADDHVYADDIYCVLVEDVKEITDESN